MKRAVHFVVVSLLLLQQEEMIIYVKTLTGKCYELNMNKDDSVAVVKEALHDLVGHDSVTHELIYSARILRNDQYLNECNVNEGETIYLAMKHHGKEMFNRVIKIHVKLLIGKFIKIF